MFKYDHVGENTSNGAKTCKLEHVRINNDKQIKPPINSFGKGFINRENKVLCQK